MRFAIFGDIHSNLEALEAVLEDMQAQGVTHTVCTGDIVGNMASPRECLEIVRGMGCPIVLGDTDEKLAPKWDLETPGGGRVYKGSALTTEQAGFLRSMPLVRQFNSFTVVHASLDNPEKWRYVYNAADATASFQAHEAKLCFFGHTCVPHVFISDENGVQEFFYKKINLMPGKRYFVNVGSVGQPQDGDWRAAYVIYDSEAQTVELRRLPYDLAKAKRKFNDGL